MQTVSHPEIVYCAECGKTLYWKDLTRNQRNGYHDRKRRRVYCSKECGKAYSRRVSSETMARTNRKYASERMKANNPMSRPEVREKVIETFHRIGQKPKTRGGNGTGLTEPQARLMELFAILEPIGEYAVKTGVKMNNNPNHYPTCYKIDIAIPAHMLAIEVDGQSHNAIARREQDAKKADFLKSAGWNLLRFSNKEVMANPTACARMVMSTISK